MDPTVILNRLMRLARLDTTVFEEVRDDANETIPAIIIAVASCFLAGLGLFLWWSTVAPGKPDSLLVNSLILGTIFTAVLYGAWIVVAYFVIAQVFKAQADLISMVRTMGYGALPMAATLLMFIPLIYPVFMIVPIGLLMIFSIYAIQTCTDAEPGQVVMASLAGFTVMVLVLGFLATAQSLGKADYAVGIFGFLPRFP